MHYFGLIRSSIAVLIFLLFSTVSAQSGVDKNIVVIDPGHGGKDIGAMGIYGIKEKDVVLKLALKILQLNEKEGKFEIYLTRYTDTLIPLKHRASLTKALKADLFISLHCNHANSPYAKGLEVFVASGEMSEHQKDAIFFAYRIHKQITTTTGILGRGVKFANFQVLRETIDFTPSILIELCFLSNPDEAAYFFSEDSYNALANNIFDSL